MNNFWSLVGFEYKKIIMRKSVIIAIIICIGLSAFTAVSFAFGTSWQGLSGYEELMIDKENHIALSGRVLNGDLILEASEAYQTIPNDVYPYSFSDEFQQNARPYEFVYRLIDSAFVERGSAFDMNDFQNISKEDANSYYDKRISQYRTNLENNSLFTQENIERIIALDDEVEKPFVLAYIDGYDRYLQLSQTNIILIILLICFIISPIFSNEYQTGTANLILTSKNGKKSQIFAKMFASISLTALLVVGVLLTCYIAMIMFYGSHGANAQIQLLIPLTTYNFTLIEVCGLLFVTTLFGAILMTAVAMFISSVSRRSFISLTACVVFILAVMYKLPINSDFYYKALKFSPYAMGNLNEMLLQLSFNVFGIEVWLYQAVCIVALVVSSLLLLLTYQSFKRHQVT